MDIDVISLYRHFKFRVSKLKTNEEDRYMDEWNTKQLSRIEQLS